MGNTDRIIAKYVEISIDEGPVVVPVLNGSGANNEVILWDDIVGRESFPATEGSAFYHLTLKKRAERVDEVPTVEGLLKSAIDELSQVWHFAGGNMLILEGGRQQRNPRYASNAKCIEEEFLRLDGRKSVTAIFPYSWEIVGSYRSMPLGPAVNLCRAAATNIALKKVLKYYYDGIVDQEKWFVHIYKVRDALCEVFGNGKAVQSTLGISSVDWNDFGRILNNYDLRHPDVSSTNVVIPKEEIARVKELAHTWLAKYMRHVGLQPL